MDDTDTKAAPVPQPEPKTRTRSVLTPDLIAMLIAIVTVGIALAAIIVGATLHIDGRVDAAAARSDARFEKFFAEAAADRRAADAKMQAFHEGMNEFRREMQRLGERQARLQGQRESGTAR